MVKIHPAAVDKAVAEQDIKLFRALLSDARRWRQYYDEEAQRLSTRINKAKRKLLKAEQEMSKK